MGLGHGAPWTSFNLRHLIQQLTQDDSVYSFDLLDHWKLDELIIICHDFGSATALSAHLVNARRRFNSPIRLHSDRFKELPDDVLYWDEMVSVPLFFKMLAIAVYQGFHRMGKMTFKTPKDAAFVDHHDSKERDK